MLQTRSVDPEQVVVSYCDSEQVVHVLQTRSVPVNPEPEHASDSYCDREQVAAQLPQTRSVDPKQAVI